MLLIVGLSSLVATVLVYRFALEDKLSSRADVDTSVDGFMPYRLWRREYARVTGFKWWLTFCLLHLTTLVSVLAYILVNL